MRGKFGCCKLANMKASCLKASEALVIADGSRYPDWLRNSSNPISLTARNAWFLPHWVSAALYTAPIPPCPNKSRMMYCCLSTVLGGRLPVDAWIPWPGGTTGCVVWVRGMEDNAAPQL